MNHCAIQRKRETVVCPKPRRLGLVYSMADEAEAPYLRPQPMRWLVSHHQEPCDAKAGNELLDIILTKGGSCTDQSGSQVDSSPRFFSGSPPSRVSNPLIKDSRFGDENFAPISPRAIAILPDSTRKNNRARANFGSNPTVRIEGFECLDRDRRNRSIPTLA